MTYKMSSLKNIQKSVSNYFGKLVVPITKLKDSSGSKTVRHAKAVAIYLARTDGHSNDDIAKEFGYKNSNSVSNIFNKIDKELPLNLEFKRDIAILADELSIDL